MRTMLHYVAVNEAHALNDSSPLGRCMYGCRFRVGKSAWQDDRFSLLPPLGKSAARFLIYSCFHCSICPWAASHLSAGGQLHKRMHGKGLICLSKEKGVIP